MPLKFRFPIMSSRAKKILPVFFMLLALGMFVYGGLWGKPEAEARATLLAKVIYSCGSDVIVLVKYFSYNDGRLGFMKLNWGSGDVVLPEVLSATGTRYLDMRRGEWWQKDDRAWFYDEPWKGRSVGTRCVEESRTTLPKS